MSWPDPEPLFSRTTGLGSFIGHADDLNLVATELEDYRLGCGVFCEDCDTGLGYAYDSTVLETSPGQFEAWVQGAAASCSSQAVDTIVEYSATTGMTTRVGDVSPNVNTGCPGFPKSCAASPDALRHSNGDRLLFYSWATPIACVAV